MSDIDRKLVISGRQKRPTQVYSFAEWSSLSRNPVISACVKLIVETASSQQFQVLTADGEATESALHKVINVKPNLVLSPLELKRNLIFSLLWYGNAYARIVRQGGTLIGLHPLYPGQVAPYIKQSRIYYEVTGDTKENLKQSEVFHAKICNYADAYIGEGVGAKLLSAFRVADSSQKALARYYERGGGPKGLLTSDMPLNPKQRAQIRQAMSENNEDDLIVLEAGFRYSTLSDSFVNSGFNEVSKLTRSDICAVLGVPESLIFGIAQQSDIDFFAASVIAPLLAAVEDALQSQLLTDSEQGNMRVNICNDGIARAPLTARVNYIATMLAHGAITPNEARALDGKPPMHGGDTLRAPLNMSPPVSPGADTRPPDQRGGDPT
jgi:HK97 family phage portal protein